MVETVMSDLGSPSVEAEREGACEQRERSNVNNKGGIFIGSPVCAYLP
jgi:hypothetical protein